MPETSDLGNSCLRELYMCSRDSFKNVECGSYVDHGQGCSSMYLLILEVALSDRGCYQGCKNYATKLTY